MRFLAEFVMRGRRQAILVALLFTVLPLLGWVADAIVALVTLRKGTKEGAIVLIWVILPGTILGLMGYSQVWLYGVLGGTVVTYGFAVLLRHFNSWSMVLLIGAILGVIAVVVVHILVPDIAQSWSKDIAVYIQSLRDQGNFPVKAQDMQKGGEFLVKIATGLQAAVLLLSDLFSLLIARWAQALLYNPDGLRTELYNIRLGFVAVAMLAVIILGSLGGIDAATDSLPVVLLIFMLAGLSLVHAFFAAIDQKLWLVIFYALLVVLFPYMIGMLVMLALLDTWWNFRCRFHSKNIL